MNAAVVQRARNNLRLSQTSFGQLLGVHAMTVSKWERGLLAPNAYQASLIEAFAKASQTAELKGQIEGALVGAGIVAALLLILTASN